MKQIFTLILFLTGTALVNAVPVSCYKFSERTGMDLSDAVCILSNDSIIPFSENGWICLDTYQPITNKFKIRKKGYYEYIIYIVWEDSSEYILSLKKKIEKPLPNVYEIEKSESYILGNSKTPKRKRVARVGSPNELLLYYEAKIDTGFAFLNSFNFYLGWPISGIQSQYRINVYQLNNATVRFDKIGNILDFEPSFESTLYSTKLYDFANKEGWIKVEINQVIPSQDFIIGIEMVLSVSENDLSKKQSGISIGMTEYKNIKDKIPYKYLGTSNTSPEKNNRTTIFYPFINSSIYPEGKFCVYCEMKNYY